MPPGGCPCWRAPAGSRKCPLEKCPFPSAPQLFPFGVIAPAPGAGGLWDVVPAQLRRAPQKLPPPPRELFFVPSLQSSPLAGFGAPHVASTWGLWARREEYGESWWPAAPCCNSPHKSLTAARNNAALVWEALWPNRPGVSVMPRSRRGGPAGPGPCLAFPSRAALWARTRAPSPPGCLWGHGTVTCCFRKPPLPPGQDGGERQSKKLPLFSKW